MPAGGGGEGDPHMTTMDGTTFHFSGVPHRLHRLYSRGPLRILGRCTPIGWTPEGGDPADTSRQYFSGVDVVLGDARIVVGCDGKTHVILPDYHITIVAKVDTLDAPGHPGCTSEEPHPLMGIPHVNVTMPIAPNHRLGESGVIVDGPDANHRPEDYVVAG